MTDHDRRGQPRVREPAIAAVVHGRDRPSAVLAVRDLSTGGARLVGPLGASEGEHLVVELVLDGHPLTLVADVIRVDTVRAELAVAFRAVSPSKREQIARSLEAMLMRARAVSSPTIIVVHPDQEPRAALERDLARLGRPAHGASTILEAIWRLEDHAVRYEAAIIAADLDANVRAEILCHLEERHPEVRRVLLFGSHVESLDHASSRRVHVVLRTPWRLKGLARAVALEGSSVKSTSDLLTALDPALLEASKDTDGS